MGTGPQPAVYTNSTTGASAPVSIPATPGKVKSPPRFLHPITTLLHGSDAQAALLYFALPVISTKLSCRSYVCFPDPVGGDHV